MNAFIVGLLVFVSFLAAANDPEDIRAQLNSAKNDSVRFELQNQIFQQAVYADIDSSYACLKAQQGLLQGKNLQGKTRQKFRIDYHVNSGVYYRMKGKSEKAISHYEKALKAAKEGGFRKEAGTIYNNIANIHYQNGDYHISLDYHLKGLHVRKKVNDTMGIGMSLGNIGLIYEVRKEYKRAISYYQQAQTYFEKANQVKALAWTGRVIGTAHMEMDQFADAIKNLQESKKRSASFSDANGVNYCHLNLGVVYTKLYQKYESPRYLDSADYYLSFLKEEHANPRIEVNYLHRKARVLFERNRPSESLPLLKQALKMAQSSDLKNERKEIYELTAETQAALGNYDAAYKNQRLFKAISDTLFTIEKDQEMGRKQAEIEYNEKLKLEQVKQKNQKKIFAYEKRQQYFIIAIISLSFILVVTLFVYLYRKKMRLNKQLTRERDTILRQYKSLETAYNSVLENFERMQQAKNELPATKELPEWVAKLSKRELEVLSCLAVGMSDKEIQEKLFISVTTVRTHCQRIYSKLLVKNRVEAAHVVREYGLI